MSDRRIDGTREPESLLLLVDLLFFTLAIVALALL